MGEADLCQCSTCGRMHKSLGFGKPPEAIAGPTLLKSAELLGPISKLTEQIARDLFGPRNHVWDKRWQTLHEIGLRFQDWAGDSPTEGKSFYFAQAQIAIDPIKRKIDFWLNEHLCDMQEGYDDSIVGFNEAWDIVRKVFSEPLAT